MKGAWGCESIWAKTVENIFRSAWAPEEKNTDMITCLTSSSSSTSFTSSASRYYSTKVLCSSVNILNQSTWVMKRDLMLWHLCSDFNGFHMTYHCLHRYPVKTLNVSCRVLCVSNKLHYKCEMWLSAPAVKAHLCLILCFLPTTGAASVERCNKETWLLFNTTVRV